jgi:hypothetical protein
MKRLVLVENEIIPPQYHHEVEPSLSANQPGIDIEFVYQFTGLTKISGVEDFPIAGEPLAERQERR